MCVATKKAIDDNDIQGLEELFENQLNNILNIFTVSINYEQQIIELEKKIKESVDGEIYNKLYEDFVVVEKKLNDSQITTQSVPPDNDSINKLRNIKQTIEEQEERISDLDKLVELQDTRIVEMSQELYDKNSTIVFLRRQVIEITNKYDKVLKDNEQIHNFIRQF
jgi:hypothetical protein